MSSSSSNAAAHATATSAPDHSVWFHGTRGEDVLSLLGAWHHRTRSVSEIGDHIQTRISSPGGIADGVTVPTLRTSPGLTPSTRQGPQKRATPKTATTPKSPKFPNVPIGAPHPRKPAGLPWLVGGEMDSHPQRELRGPRLPFPGRETVISDQNWAIIKQSTRVIEGRNPAPWGNAEWGTMASPMGPIVVDSDTLSSLGGLPEPRSGRACLRQGSSALLFTNLTPKTVNLARPPLTTTAIWVRLVKQWP